MITRDEIMERRDELMARRDELIERVGRIREDFAENVDADTVSMAAGLSLTGGGIAWWLARTTRGKHGFFGALLPLGLIAAGLTLAGRGAMDRRGVRIAEAEERMRGELSTLDPLARARVLRDMANDQLTFVHHSPN